MTREEIAIPVKNKVLLKKLVNTLDKKYGDLYIPQKYSLNESLGIAQIVRMGSTAGKNSGLKSNDYVLYDYFAVYADNPEYVLIDVSNIILQLTEDEAYNYVNNSVIQKKEN